MQNQITLANAVTSPAAPGTVVGPTVDTQDADFAVTFAFFATLAGATGGTLDVYVQDSPDGATWYDFLHFAQVAAAAPIASFCVQPAQWVAATQVTTIGVGTLAAPGVALAANGCRSGQVQRFMRYVFVAGAGTSAGAAQTLRLIGRSPMFKF